MRLTDVLKQWLTEQEWEEQPELDEEAQTSSTEFGFRIEDFSLTCFYEANEQGEIFKLYMYFMATKCPERCLDEVQTLVMTLNNTLAIGTLQLQRDERVMRFYSGIDVENAAFEPAHIQNLLNAGVRALSDALPKYMAICFGGKTAEEVLAEEG